MTTRRSGSSRGERRGGRPLLFRLSLALNLVTVMAVVVLGLRRSQRDGEATGPSPVSEARRSHLASLPVRPGQVVMLGDSLTERCEWAELLGPPLGWGRVVNRGMGWETTRGVHRRLGPILAGSPSQVVIMVGINDLHHGARPAAVLVDYRALLEEATQHRPATRVVVQSVLPVRPSPTSGTVDNADIEQLNRGLRELAEELGADFVDVAAAMRDERGALAAELTEDGVHLNGAGYQAWARVLQPHLAGR